MDRRDRLLQRGLALAGSGGLRTPVILWLALSVPACDCGTFGFGAPAASSSGSTNTHGTVGEDTAGATTAGTSASTTTVTSGPAGTSSAADTSSTDPSSSAGSGTSGIGGDTGAKCCEAMDLLFVVDQSWYPNAECFEDRLVESLVLFPVEAYAALADNIESYHVGYTFASDIPNAPPCQAMGSLSRGVIDPEDSPEGCLPKLGGVPYLDSAVVKDYLDFVNGIFCLMSLGVADAPSPRPVEAMIEASAVDNSAPEACNDGFARTQAPLLIFVLTSDDQDPAEDFVPDNEGADVDHWWKILQERRGFAKGDIVTGKERTGMIRVALPPGPVKAGCTAEPVDRFGHFTAYFNPDKVRSYDLCELNEPKHQKKGCGSYEGQSPEVFRTFLVEALEQLVCSLCAD